MGQREAGELVRKYRDQTGMTQEAIATLLSQLLGRTVRQGQVSDHMKGLRWRDVDLPGAYVKVLGIPPVEMAAAYGLELPKAPRQWTIAEVVKDDPTLSAAAKRHLLSQYELLQMATRQERSGKPPLGKKEQG